MERSKQKTNLWSKICLFSQTNVTSHWFMFNRNYRACHSVVTFSWTFWGPPKNGVILYDFFPFRIFLENFFKSISIKMYKNQNCGPSDIRTNIWKWRAPMELKISRCANMNTQLQIIVNPSLRSVFISGNLFSFVP